MKECPAPNCPAIIESSRVLCRRHRRQLSPKTRLWIAAAEESGRPGELKSAGRLAVADLLERKP